MDRAEINLPPLHRLSLAPTGALGDFDGEGELSWLVLKQLVARLPLQKVCQEVAKWCAAAGRGSPMCSDPNDVRWDDLCVIMGWPAAPPRAGPSNFTPNLRPPPSIGYGELTWRATFFQFCRELVWGRRQYGLGWLHVAYMAVRNGLDEADVPHTYLGCKTTAERLRHAFLYHAFRGTFAWLGETPLLDALAEASGEMYESTRRRENEYAQLDAELTFLVERWFGRGLLQPPAGPEPDRLADMARIEALVEQGAIPDRTLIFKALRESDVRLIQKLLALGVDPNAVIQKLPALGVDPNAVNSEGQSLLTLFLAQKWRRQNPSMQEIKRLLLLAGARPATFQTAPPPPTVIALILDAATLTEQQYYKLERQNVSLEINYLYDFGRDDRAGVTMPGAQRSVLMVAAENGNVGLVRGLLSDPRIRVNLQNRLGKTALILAAQNGQAQVVRLLLQQPREPITMNQLRDALTAAERSGRPNVEEVQRLLRAALGDLTPDAR